MPASYFTSIFQSILTKSSLNGLLENKRNHPIFCNLGRNLRRCSTYVLFIFRYVKQERNGYGCCKQVQLINYKVGYSAHYLPILQELFCTVTSLVRQCLSSLPHWAYLSEFKNLKIVFGSFFRRAPFIHNYILRIYLYLYLYTYNFVTEIGG